MDTILVMGAALLVGNKYRLERKIKNQKNQSALIDKEEEDMNDPVLDLNAQNDIDESTATLGITNNVTSGGLPFAPTNSSVKVATQYTTDQVEEEKDSNEKSFLDQFYPQNNANTGSSVMKKPWMLSVENAYPKPREEHVVDFPTRDDRDDFLNKDMDKKIRSQTRLQTKNTIHISKEKNHDRAIEPEWTATGEGRGFHPVKRYHQAMPSTGTVLDQPGAPKGAFAGASKSSKFQATENRRMGRQTEHFGTGVAPVFKVPFKGSIQVDPSNAEGYNLEKHHNMGAYLPFKASFNIQDSFSTAHDESIDTFENDINVGKTRTKSLNPRASVQDNSADLTSKDTQIQTPSMVGSVGGTRLKSVFKDAKMRTSDHSERLGQKVAEQSLGAAGASKNKHSKMVVPDGLEQMETTLGEADDFKSTGNLRKTNAMRTKASKNFGEMITNDNKEHIGEKDFTSKNFVAPVSQNSNLPMSLRKKPTTSMSNVSVELKSDEDRVKTIVNRSTLVSHKPKPRSALGKPDMDMSDNSFKFATILSDRLGAPVRKSGRNPYIKREVPAIEM